MWICQGLPDESLEGLDWRLHLITLPPWRILPTLKSKKQRSYIFDNFEYILVDCKDPDLSLELKLLTGYQHKQLLQNINPLGLPDPIPKHGHHIDHSHHQHHQKHQQILIQALLLIEPYLIGVVEVESAVVLRQHLAEVLAVDQSVVVVARCGVAKQVQLAQLGLKVDYGFEFAVEEDRRARSTVYLEVAADVFVGGGPSDVWDVAEDWV